MLKFTPQSSFVADDQMYPLPPTFTKEPELAPR